MSAGSWVSVRGCVRVELQRVFLWMWSARECVFFFFSWTVRETERTLIVLCLLICRLGGEARAVSPLSDVTRLWYRTPSSLQITDHPKNTPPFYHSGSLPLCSPHLLWLTVSSGVSVARTELCQTEIPRGASWCHGGPLTLYFPPHFFFHLSFLSEAADVTDVGPSGRSATQTVTSQVVL